jgi:hypothetical protein
MRSQGGSLRPDEVAAEILGPSATGARLVREDLLVESGGRLVSPLPAGSREAAV